MYRIDIVQIHITKNTSEIKETPAVLQSTLQGWSHLGYSTATPCNAAAHLGASPYMSVDKPVPSSKAEVSYLHYLIQNSRYENTWQVYPMNFVNINPDPENIYMQA